MLAEDIAKYLASKGVGVIGTNLFSELPSLPDDAAAVREYPGGRPVHVKGQAAPVMRNPRGQMVTRSKDARAARMRAEDCFRHLSGFSGEIGSPPYRIYIRALQDPFPIGRDESGRERVVFNFEAMK